LQLAACAVVGQVIHIAASLRLLLVYYRVPDDKETGEENVGSRWGAHSMKFTITREKLHEGLNAVAASVPTKTTLPVLSNILVEAT
jgi:hypothetical protein